MKSLALALLAACTVPGVNNNPDASTNPGQDGTVQPDAGPMMPSNNVTIIVEPNGKHGNELVAAIGSATQSVYMTMYEMSDSDVVTALIARKQAGADVQVILDVANKGFNTSSFNALKSGGVNVVYSSTAFTYTHEKTVIIDGKVAWIMTMNANTSSPDSNREYLAIDTDANDIVEATAIFKADHSQQAITPTGNLVVADTNARQKLVNFIYSAQTTLDVEGEEFSDTNTNGVVDAVAAAAKRGVTVHVIIANDTLDATAVSRVKNSGGQVVVTGPTSGNGTQSNPYIHAKAIVVDGTVAFVGSENFSAGSLGYNRELGVIFDTAAEVAKVKSAIDTDFGRGTAQ
jgi:cardiolipin synthase A/B